ncbi:MAG: hypothetical protein ABFS24_09775 [Pseudomonadota bacterium]
MNTVTEGSVSANELDIASMQLGIDRLEFSLHTREDVRAIAQTLAEQAQRGLMLLTLDLEPAIFDQQPFLNAISKLARQHQNAWFRILILDSHRASQNGHRLIELSRRLSPNIQFRCPPPEYQDTGKTFLICDDAGYFYRPLASRYEGTANFNDAGEVARLEKYFMELWDRSEPDSELRLLHV